MKRVAALFAMLPLALAACGAAGTARSTSTREQAAVAGHVSFAEQAATICKGLLSNADVISRGRKPTDAEFGRLLARWRAGFDRLAQLDPPAERAKPFNRMLGRYRTMVAALAAVKTSDDENVLGDLAAVVVEGTRGSRESRRAALPACAFFPGLNQPRRDPEPMLVATQALVPRTAHIVKADANDCNKEASCRVEFQGTGSTAVRLRAALSALRAQGWTHVETGRSPTGSSWATGYRNDYEVEIELLGTPSPPHCAGAPPELYGCSDSVWVHRVEIPDVLTGG
jgi:hypothetical protein